MMTTIYKPDWIAYADSLASEQVSHIFNLGDGVWVFGRVEALRGVASLVHSTDVLLYTMVIALQTF